MYFVFLALWIIFNGNLTLEIFLFGVVIAALLYAFICKFMEFSIHKDILLWKKFFLMLRYLVILIVEIVKANVSAMKLLFSEKNEIEPVLVRFRTTLKTKTAKVVLANSITLTPGTITVSLEGDEFQVHCLDKTLAEGLSDGIFVKELEKMERM
ncbi:MAG: Na+/H+ antiporter subunit E [Lachnospiraceae bacterium]|nr:Na+/H+ antiporter subunit E [Lachnospiraceae bacterium]